MEGKIERLTYLLYIIANVLILFNPGVYWDDWAIYNMSDRGIMTQFYGNGVVPVGYLHILLKNISGSPVLYNAITFVSQLIALYALFRIVGKLTLKRNIRIFFLFAVMIFAVFPFYDAKVTMIVLPYTLCFTFFVVASLFLLKFHLEKKFLFRILSWIFFFISFFTNSLLFFYLLPIFFILFYEYWYVLVNQRFKQIGEVIPLIIKRIFKYLDFFILPFVFWVVRSIYFMPSNQYAEIGYNEVQFGSLLQIPFRIVKMGYVLVITLLPLLADAYQHIEFIVLAAVFTFVLIWHFSKWDLDIKISRNMFLWGIVVLLIGSFPYLLVNKFPSYVGYSSRHQILQGIGFTMILGSIIFLLPWVNLRKFILAGSLGLFISFTMYLHFSYFKGYIKQEVYLNYFASESIEIDESQSWLLEENTANFTTKGNPVVFYELAGIYKKSNSAENVLIVRDEDLKKYKKRNLFQLIEPYLFQYNLTHYEYTEPEYILKVNYSDKALPQLPFLSYYSDYFKGNTAQWSNYFDIDIFAIK